MPSNLTICLPLFFRIANNNAQQYEQFVSNSFEEDEDDDDDDDEWSDDSDWSDDEQTKTVGFSLLEVCVIIESRGCIVDDRDVIVEFSMLDFAVLTFMQKLLIS